METNDRLRRALPPTWRPEVLLQRPDDGRSDIFSLGLVFYEMLGGDQPF